MLKPSSRQDEIALKANLVLVAHNFCILKTKKYLLVTPKKLDKF